MKKVKASLITCTLSLAILLEGCGLKSSIKMPYDEKLSYDTSVTAPSNESLHAKFVSNDYCIVPLGEDTGNDANIQSGASLLFDITNKKPIYASNIYEKIYPASLTKIMTALVVLDQCDLNDVVTVSKNAANITEVGAKLCGLKEGDQVVLKDLVTALLVYSGNDAGVAIADYIAGSEEKFCELMNKKAKQIGAVNTHFTNSHGLHDENHYTTAYDMYLIFQNFLSYDSSKEMIEQSKFLMNYKDANGSDKSAEYCNTNKYLQGEYSAPEGIKVDGGKTGTTNAAGSCLEILVEDQKGNSYIVMVLKATDANSLYRQMNLLMEKIK